MGGVAIFLGFAFTILLWWPQQLIAEFRLFLGACILMFVIGLKDDIIPLKPWQKLLSQFVPIGIILFADQGLIHSFYGFMGIDTISMIMAVVITLFTCVVIVNSINLLDGADGLAGSVCLVSIASLGAWFYLTGNANHAILSWSFAGGIIGFLVFNWRPAKIFMGDTGALVMGLTVAYLVVQFLNINAALPIHHEFRLNGITIAVSLGFVPLFDTLRVFTIRVLKGKSPFVGDKNHIHHILMRAGFNHGQLTLILVAVNLAFIGMGIVSSYFSEEIGLLLMVFMGLLFSFATDLLIIRSTRSGQGQSVVMRIIKSSKKDQHKAS